MRRSWATRSMVSSKTKSASWWPRKSSNWRTSRDSMTRSNYSSRRRLTSIQRCSSLTRQYAIRLMTTRDWRTTSMISSFREDPWASQAWTRSNPTCPRSRRRTTRRPAESHSSRVILRTHFHPFKISELKWYAWTNLPTNKPPSWRNLSTTK